MFITFTVGGLINWLVGWLDGLLVNELPGGVTFILHPCLGRDVRKERGKGAEWTATGTSPRVWLG